MSEVPEMVDRVARAMAKSAHPISASLQNDDLPPPHVMDYYRTLARVAIAAMREPTEAMVAAAIHIEESQMRGSAVELDPFSLRRKARSAQFGAMLDAALKGE